MNPDCEKLNQEAHDISEKIAGIFIKEEIKLDVPTFIGLIKIITFTAIERKVPLGIFVNLIITEYQKQENESVSRVVSDILDKIELANFEQKGQAH